MSRPKSKGEPSKGEPCTRPLAEQCADRTGAMRRIDHPKVQRLELLGDLALDAYRAGFPEESERALEQYDELEAHVAQLDQLSSERAAELPAKPILTTVVCLSCGASEVIRASRPWPIDRAMGRSGLSERDVLEVVALLQSSLEEVPDLESMRGEVLRELKSLAPQAPSAEEVRELCGAPTSEVRTTRADMLREMERRGIKFPSS